MARDFDGNDDVLESSTLPASATLPFTMACWANPDNVTVDHTAMAMQLDSAANEAYLLVLAGGIAGDPVRARARSAAANANSNTSTSFTSGAWQHVCAVFTSTSSRTAYLNGGGAVENTTLSVPAGMDKWRIGSRGTIANDWTNGKIAEAAVWDVALTATEVAVLATGAHPFTVRPGSLVYYNPIIGKFSPEIDLISGNNTTVTGAVAFAHPRIFPYQIRTNVPFSTSVAVTSTIAGNLVPLSASLSVLHGNTATIGATLIPLTASLTVEHAVPVTSEIAGNLVPLSASLTAVMNPSATIEATLVPLSASLTALHFVPVEATIGATLQPLSASLEAAHPYTATIAASIQPLTASLTAIHPVSATVDASLQPLSASLTGFLGSTKSVGNQPGGLVAQESVVSGIIESKDKVSGGIVTPLHIPGGTVT